MKPTNSTKTDVPDTFRPLDGHPGYYVRKKAAEQIAVIQYLRDNPEREGLDNVAAAQRMADLAAIHVFAAEDGTMRRLTGEELLGVLNDVDELTALLDKLELMEAPAEVE